MSAPGVTVPAIALETASAQRVAGSVASPSTIREAFPIFARHGSPRLLAAGVLAALLVRLRLGAWSVWDLVPIAATLLVWPVQEWLIHVCILHFKPFTVWGRTVEFRIPRKHRAHHRDPWNHEILFIPLHALVYIYSLDLLLWLAAAPNPALAMTGVTFSLALALHYEWVHFLIHTRVAPRTRYYQRLWRHHRLHHFKNENYWYGVTRLEGDRLLGTAPTPTDVAISPTARTLVVRGE